jgi:hypothetical protein
MQLNQQMANAPFTAEPGPTIGAIVITITIFEFLADRVAFTSAYNWLHI